jgi:hypothetical protein
MRSNKRLGARVFRLLAGGSPGRPLRRAAGLIALLSALVLVPLISACGEPSLSYAFVDGESRDYRLTMTVAEKSPNRETLGTVDLEALLRVGASINESASCACFATVDYQDPRISTNGAAATSGDSIPRGYFPLHADGLLGFTAPTPRGDGYSVDIARTGPNGSLSVMLLNTFVGKCLAQPLRDSVHGLKKDNEWTTVRQSPGEFLTYLYTGVRTTGSDNRETTNVKVTGLTDDGALAELSWSSLTPLRGSKRIDLTESFAQSGIDLAYVDSTQLQPTIDISGWSDCSGVSLVRTSDGWPQRVSVDRMTLDLTYWWDGWSEDSPSGSDGQEGMWPRTWSLVPSYPADLLSSQAAGPVEVILEITGAIEAVS